MLLRVAEAHPARQWLRTLAPSKRRRSVQQGPEETIGEAYQVAFTAAGLQALGVDRDIVERFSPEFVEGMAGSDNRSHRLGDIGTNAPPKWNWGVGDKEPHVLLMLFAKAKGLDASPRKS